MSGAAHEVSGSKRQQKINHFVPRPLCYSYGNKMTPTHYAAYFVRGSYAAPMRLHAAQHMALAYFITFTTYGTWLPGMAKGSVDREHNAFGTPWVPADEERERLAREAMVQEPYVMRQSERDMVCQAIVGLATDRHWQLLAMHVRSNHVHVVIAADRDPERIMSDMKARASRDLVRAGFGTADRRRWTRHGSTRHLFREADICNKVRYTLNEQGERMAWYVHPEWNHCLEEPRTGQEPRTQ